MGNCGSVNKVEAKQNNEINDYLRQERRKMDDEVKLLLLGNCSSVFNKILKLESLFEFYPYLSCPEPSFSDNNFNFCRCWRIGQEHNSKTNEDYSSRRF